MKSFIIKGGNFKNSGAEAMTYIAINELRKRYPDCLIHLISNYDYFASRECDNFKFDITKFDINNYNYMRSPIKKLTTSIIVKLKDIKNHRNDYVQLKYAEEIIKNCDAIIDISGFALSSQWGLKASTNYLNFIETANKYNIPVFLMPQSFGPFDYGNETNKMIQRIKSVLSVCRVIYAREQEGYNFLKNLGLTNVKYSCDMVLQNTGIESNRIFINRIEHTEISLPTVGNVAIIPNMRNFDHGNKERLMEVYSHLVDKLLSLQKEVYLISHSKEDYEACVLIKNMFSDVDRVRLLDNNLDSFSFTGIIKKFDFVIASRFHSIVHSYKEGIPCIAIGWATKYYELLELFGCGKYMIDVRSIPDEEQIDCMIEAMNTVWKKEHTNIERVLQKLQQNSCFEHLDF